MLRHQYFELLRCSVKNNQMYHGRKFHYARQKIIKCTKPSLKLDLHKMSVMMSLTWFRKIENLYKSGATYV